MKADIAFETMERILPHLSAILNDEEASKIVKALRGDKNRLAGDTMQELLPLFLGPHKEDMLGIVAGIKGCTAEEAKAMELREINTLLRENFVGDMVLFFANCLTMARCM